MEAKENTLTKQNIIDIILEDLENGGSIMTYIKQYFSHWNNFTFDDGRRINFIDLANERARKDVESKND